MKKLIVLWMLLVATVAGATEPPIELEPSKWVVGALASSEAFKLRVGLAGPQGGEAGFFGAWYDDYTGDKQERYGGGLYGTWRIVDQGSWNLRILLPFGLSEILPAIFYDAHLGVEAGMMEDVAADGGCGAIAALLAEVSVGPNGIVRIGYSYGLDANLWNQLPDQVKSNHTLWAGPVFALGGK